jgi:hypothetical protein
MPTQPPPSPPPQPPRGLPPDPRQVQPPYGGPIGGSGGTLYVAVPIGPAAMLAKVPIAGP